MIPLQTKHSYVISQGRCIHKGCKSSDAYTIYGDGSTYCFSCSRYTPSAEGEHKGRVYMGQPEESVNRQPYSHSLRQEINIKNCKELYLYLRQHLEDDEIKQWFFYSPTHSRYVFAHDEDGDYFYESRGTSNRVPKSLHEGTKPTLIFGKVKETGVVVVVEDIISAIKVSRHFGVLPLFGSHMTEKMQAKLSHVPDLKLVVMWLDIDKFSAGMCFAKKMGILVPSVAVKTYKDPKAYGDVPIKYLVNSALEQWESLNE